MACKIEEVHCPPLSTFIWACGGKYSVNEFIEAEARVLQTLEYKLVVSTSLQCLQAYAEQLKLSESEFWTTRYFLDHTFSSAEFCCLAGSQLAGGVVVAAQSALRLSSQTVDSFIKSNNLSKTEVMSCAARLWQNIVCRQGSPLLRSTQMKYESFFSKKLQEQVNTG